MPIQTDAFVIAEGIEDDETLEFLLGIDELGAALIQGGQGYGLGHPTVDHRRHPRLAIAHPVQSRLTVQGGTASS